MRAQDDALPGHGSYPTSRWQLGQVVIDEYQLIAPADAPAQEYQIEIGMYNLQTGARVGIINADGAPMENDRVLFKRFPLP